jgi:signal peptidase
MKFLFNFIYYFFVIAIVLIASLVLTTLVPVPGNLKVKVVKSGSMEPYIKTGGIVVIKPSTNYLVNDVITFGEDTRTQIPTTHRIISVVGEGSSVEFITKGDANDTEDPEKVKPSTVKGKVVLTIPYLGYVLDFAKQPLGFGILVGVPAFVIIIEEIGKIIAELRNMKRRKLESTQNEQQN